MKRIQEVIKSKNRIEKSQRLRRKEEIARLRTDAAFKARLQSEMRKVDAILNSHEIEYVCIQIPDQFLAKFGESLYSEDLIDYDVQQVEGVPNEFYVRHKYLKI